MGNYLIIGASSSIAQEVVSQARQVGHTVFQAARSKAKIDPDEIVDATDFEAVERVFRIAKEKLGRIDGVLNAAGSLLLRAAHQTSKEQYMNVIDSSLTTAFAVVRAAGKVMDDGGSVVLMSSAAAEIGLANHDAIAAAKAGIIGLVKSAAATYAGRNLRINAVAPGLTKTTLTSSIVGNASALKLSESMHPIGRIGDPEEVARVISFLLEPVNSWITGQVWAVDGGLSTLKVLRSQ